MGCCVGCCEGVAATTAERDYGDRVVRTTTLAQSKRLRAWGLPQLPCDRHWIRNGADNWGLSSFGDLETCTGRKVYAAYTAEELRGCLLKKLSGVTSVTVEWYADNDSWLVEIEGADETWFSARGDSEIAAWFAIAEQIFGGD